MAEKQLILVVETTAAMGPYWNTLRTDYLEKIIRCFGGNESSEQKLSVSKSEFALVTYNTHGCYSGCLVQRTGWTRDPDVFCNWLSAIPFTGGGFNDGAIAEGLAEALMMFPNSQSGGTNQQNVDMHRHCILVAASNPYPLQTPVYVPGLPNPEQSETIDSEPGNRLYDAEAVAKAFTHFSISLSVICPKQLPKVKAIYKAGNQNNGAADPPADVKTTHSFVLISESFREARGALSLCGITNLPSKQSPVKAEDVSVTPVTGAPPTSMPSVNGSIVNRQQMLAGNVTPTTVKGVMIPTPRMPQQVQSCMQPLVNNVVASIPLPQQTTCGMQSSASTYLKVWEGSLSGKRQGQPVFITKLVGYRNSSASETLAANWPPVMYIVRLISVDHMTDKQYAGKTDLLAFRAMNPHGFLNQLQERKLCAVIQLPSQTLLLSVSDKIYNLIGMLFPEDMVVYKTQLSSQQQQRQQMQFQQQHLPQLQQQHLPLLQQQAAATTSSHATTSADTTTFTAATAEVATATATTTAFLASTADSTNPTTTATPSTSTTEALTTADAATVSTITETTASTTSSAQTDS